jgi:fatty acid synthase subunit alpha
VVPLGNTVRPHFSSHWVQNAWWFQFVGYLSKSWGLGSSRSDSVLLLGITLEPPKRLTSEPEGRVGLMVLFLPTLGVLAFPWHLRALEAHPEVVAVPSLTVKNFQSDQQKFAAEHVELYMCYLGRDSWAGEVAFDQEKITKSGVTSQARQYQPRARQCLY